ncbi:hypothetical protein JCM10450v2_002417 [Rhodotorula kratochvilovae]
MARDRVAAIRARQTTGEPASAPQQSSRGGHARVQSDPFESGPRDFNPYAVEEDGGYPGRPVREEQRLPGPGWQADFSVGGGAGGGAHARSGSGGYSAVYTNRSATSLSRSMNSRSNSTGTTGSRKHGGRDYADEPAPPVPALPSNEPMPDFTSPPLASDAAYLNTPPEVPLPRDFDPTDSRSHYATNYAPTYTHPPQSRHETQYVPGNPRQPRQSSVSSSAAGARKTSLVPLVPGAAGPHYTVGDGYMEEKASTVDLVERDDVYDRRPSTVKRGGPTISKGQVPHEEMGEFFQEISDLQQALREANGHIQSIGDLHMRMLALPSSEDRMALELKEQLEDRTSTTRALFTQLRDRLHALEQGDANLRAMIPLGQSLHNLSLADVDVREQQVMALKERFKDAIQRYAEVERDHRRNQRARLERQVKVVNPGMTQDEIAGVVKAAEAGGDSAMFAQAQQTSSYRSHAARGALREVQNRAAELARIEATLIELAQLFQDMAVMVQSQDVAVQKIEQNAVETHQDMETGLGHVKQAVVHARNYRKYRWWCFGIIMIILAIILIVLCVEFVPPAIRASRRNNNNNAATTPVVVMPIPSTTVPPAPTAAAVTTTPTSSSTVSVAPSSTSTISFVSSTGSSLVTTSSTITGPEFTMSHPSDGPFPRPVPNLPESILARFSMKGKVTIVTGGSGGLGWAAAEAIAEAGGDVAVQYRSAEGMDERAANLSKKYGVKAKAYKADVAEFDAIKKLVDDVKSEFGRIDCFIANAGMGGSGRVGELEIDQWRRIQAVNYDSVFFAMKVLAPIFEAQGNGSFIATTSISARIVNVPLDQSAYNASKAAVVHLCKSVARDWRKFARVNCVSPGFFDTAMGAAPEVADTVYKYSVLGRQGDPKELAGAFLYLASDASSYTTGHDMLVDGGYTLS